MCGMSQVRRGIEFIFPTTGLFARNIYTKLWHSSSETPGDQLSSTMLNGSTIAQVELGCP